ncbi:MAG: hypothetical protein ACREBW_09065, partial [Candidatus Micrarchaeaceae archaeon]
MFGHHDDNSQEQNMTMQQPTDDGMPQNLPMPENEDAMMPMELGGSNDNTDTTMPQTFRQSTSDD